MSTNLQDRSAGEFAQEGVQKYVLPAPDEEPRLWLETSESQYVARWETKKDLEWFDEQLQDYVDAYAYDSPSRQVSALFEPDDEQNFRLEGAYQQVASQEGFTEECTYFKVSFVTYELLWEEGESSNHMTVAEYPQREPMLEPLQWFYTHSNEDKDLAEKELADVLKQVEKDL